MKNDNKNVNNSDNKKSTVDPNSKANNNNTGKILFAVFFILATIGFASIVIIRNNNNVSNELTELQTERNNLQNELTSRDSLVDEMVTTFNEIENDLRLITKKENKIDLDADKIEFSKSKKDELSEDIQYINNLLEGNKKKISALNKKLKNSGVRISGLESKIITLQQSIFEKDSSLNLISSALNIKIEEIKGLNQKMGELNETVKFQSEVIELQTNSMQKAYLTTGSFKELEEKGIVTKDGGFLFLGQEKVLQQNLSDKYFKEVNIMDVESIPVSAKSANLITKHPDGSYNFVIDSAKQQIAYLHINDPVQFWKISKYAVLETKN